MKLIGKKYSELTKQQISNIFYHVHAGSGPWKFTVDEISKEDALSLLGPYYTFDVAKVIPAEYLDDEEFMRKFIKKIKPITYPSSLTYASERLRNKADFVSYAIDEHGFNALFALEADKNKYYSNKASKLLKNKKFIIEELRKDRYSEELVNGEEQKVFDKRKKSLIALYLTKFSEVIQTDKSLLIEAIRLHPESYFSAKSEFLHDEEVLVEFFKSILEIESNEFYLARKVEVKDTKFKFVKKLCESVSELPSDAKIRKKIYSSLAKKMIQKYDVKSNEEELTL